MRLICLLALSVFCCSCASTHTHAPKQPIATSATPVTPATPATPAEQAALLGRVKSLAGTWESTGDGGETQTVIYQVSSNGSAVREVMFPGSEQEMTNMYTMDGPELVMTHYCAMGNQPHMRASGVVGNQIAFKTAGVSNLTARDQMYMGQMTIVFIDANHIREEWQSLKNGAFAEEPMSFELTRKQ